MEIRPDQTLVSEVLFRALRIPSIDEFWLATTEEASDDSLVEHVQAGFGNTVGIYRGDRRDVRSRFLSLAKSRKADIVVRVTADDPFRCPSLAQLAIANLESHSADFVGLREPFPIGLETEVFTTSALEESSYNYRGSLDVEHVTYSMRRDDTFNSVLITPPFPLQFEFGLTVDNRDDLERARIVAARLDELGGGYSWVETLGAVSDLVGLRKDYYETP